MVMKNISKLFKSFLIIPFILINLAANASLFEDLSEGLLAESAIQEMPVEVSAGFVPIAPNWVLTHSLRGTVDYILHNNVKYAVDYQVHSEKIGNKGSVQLLHLVKPMPISPVKRLRSNKNFDQGEFFFVIAGAKTLYNLNVLSFSSAGGSSFSREAIYNKIASICDSVKTNGDSAAKGINGSICYHFDGDLDQVNSFRVAGVAALVGHANSYKVEFINITEVNDWIDSEIAKFLLLKKDTISCAKFESLKFSEKSLGDINVELPQYSRKGLALIHPYFALTSTTMPIRQAVQIASGERVDVEYYLDLEKDGLRLVKFKKPVLDGELVKRNRIPVDKLDNQRHYYKSCDDKQIYTIFAGKPQSDLFIQVGTYNKGGGVFQRIMTPGNQKLQENDYILTGVATRVENSSIVHWLNPERNQLIDTAIAASMFF